MLVLFAALIGLGLANELPEPKVVHLGPGSIEISFEGNAFHYVFLLITYCLIINVRSATESWFLSFSITTETGFVVNIWNSSIPGDSPVVVNADGRCSAMLWRRIREGLEFNQRYFLVSYTYISENLGHFFKAGWGRGEECGTIVSICIWFGYTSSGSTHLFRISAIHVSGDK